MKTRIVKQNIHTIRVKAYTTGYYVGSVVIDRYCVGEFDAVLLFIFVCISWLIYIYLFSGNFASVFVQLWVSASLSEGYDRVGYICINMHNHCWDTNKQWLSLVGQTWTDGICINLCLSIPI